MLKKKLGLNALEGSWRTGGDENCYKILSTLIIPEDCREIGIGTFQNCKRLKKVLIPRSVEWIGGFAFKGCYNATIILKKPKSEFKFIGVYAFEDCKSVEYVEEEARD